MFSVEQAIPNSTKNPSTTVICVLLSVIAGQSPHGLVLAAFKDQPLNFDQKDFLRFFKESYDSSCPIKPTPKISPNKLSRVIAVNCRNASSFACGEIRSWPRNISAQFVPKGSNVEKSSSGGTESSSSALNVLRQSNVCHLRFIPSAGRSRKTLAK